MHKLFGATERPLRALLLLTFIMGGSQSAVADDLVLHVRARTRIDLDGVERVARGIVVRGRLTDVALEEAVPGHTVAIAVTDEHGYRYAYAEPTQPDGGFVFRVPLALGRYTLRLNGGGGGDYAPTPTVVRSLDVARRTTNLTIFAPESASVAETEILVEI